MKEGDWAHLYGDVCEVIRLKSDRIAVVYFIGRTTEGKFGQLQGGMDCLVSNLQPYAPPLPKAERMRP